MTSATKRKTELTIEGKPATFDYILVRHACAASAIHCSTSADVPDEAAAAFGDACRALIRTPAAQPLQIAYKLREAFTDMVESPDTFLDVATALEVVSDDGAHHDVALIASAFLDLSAMDQHRRESGLGAEAKETFRATLDARHAALRHDNELLQAVGAAADQVEAEAPTPSDLRMKSGGTYYRDDLIEDAPDLTFAQKIDLLAVLHEWRPRRDVAEERSGYLAANEAWSNFDADPTLDALVETPVGDNADLAAKVREYLARVHCGAKSQDVDDPDTLSELLTDPDWSGPGPIVRLYQDALRLAGQRPDLASVQPFDANAWTDAFIALPGHSIGFHGPTYQWPQAWPEGTATDAELTVHDPAVLAALFEGETLDFNAANGVTLSKNSADRVRTKLGDFPAVRDQLLEVISRSGRPPIGSQLWVELRPWQQKYVLSAMRLRYQEAREEAEAARTGSALV